ncbi:c-type cytochrome biogenesis protein CcmI [Martelella soudanensis]|uniref:c-type cytochrome biogenesis protein CcmI n=1 Tax=unclassified Martelella TaxID=2629616 RepID=UPI0015DD63ED|nr:MULTISPECIES: c-type cytochrome biogenesis protein CcmI [unclassified Martelella]
MMFALVAIFLTLAVAFAVAAPLFGRDATVVAAAAGSNLIYREQLQELEREKQNGRIDDEAYASARAEIGRRLIAAEAKSADRSVVGRSIALRHRLIAASVVFAALAGAGLVYPLLGAPGAKDYPLAARLNAENPELAVLVAQVERHLAQNPGDGRGWDVIAPVYLRENKFQRAHEAYSNAIRISGPSPERLLGLGETLVALGSGVVDDEAVEVFRQLDDVSPGNIRAGYYIALASEQAGDYEDALDLFVALLERMPETAAGRDVVARHIAFNRDQLGQEEEQIPGPDQQDIEAAASLSPQQRTEMVEGMVSGLAERLEREPDDIDGWMRLIRSYAVLGREGDAISALNSALAFFGAESAAGMQIEALAAELALSGGKS